ncbi:MAG: acyl-CoA thioesterase [Lachnospiraceae bacterium]|nr:acyl-CoA thioesterase [Lachnospiraceae bacterium]
MSNAMAGKPASYAKTEQIHLVHPSDLNGMGRLSGGAILKMIDELAAIVAMRHAQCSTVTTVAIDNLTFKEGAHENDLLVMIGYVTYTGNTSLEVRIDTYVENRQGLRRSINRAYVVMVVLDQNEQPSPVPPLTVETEAQRAEWEAAIKRKCIRLERKKAGF